MRCLDFILVTRYMLHAKTFHIILGWIFTRFQMSKHFGVGQMLQFFKRLSEGTNTCFIFTRIIFADIKYFIYWRKTSIFIRHGKIFFPYKYILGFIHNQQAAHVLLRGTNFLKRQYSKGTVSLRLLLLFLGKLNDIRALIFLNTLKKKFSKFQPSCN